MISKRLDYIRENAHLSDQEICHNLGIKRDFLEAIKEHNGLKNKYSRWQDWEIDYMNEHYGNVSCEHIAQELDRTVPSVQKKASMLGLTN